MPRPSPLPDPEMRPESRQFIESIRMGRLLALLSAPDTEWPNGLVISPDDKTLYLIEANKVEGGARAIRAFDLSPEGTLSNRRVHLQLLSGT